MAHILLTLLLAASGQAGFASAGKMVRSLSSKRAGSDVIIDARGAVSQNQSKHGVTAMEIAAHGLLGVSNEVDALRARLDSLSEGVDERLRKIEQRIGQVDDKEDSSRIPKHLNDDGSSRDLSLFERIRYMEQKVDGATNWLKDPQLFRRQQMQCKNMSDVGTDHHVCFDHWDKATMRHNQAHQCVVYDLGIRANPEFGVNMMKQYGCAVRAYDPSPISKTWWDKNAAAFKSYGDLYKFYPTAAGGEDGNMELFDYNWDQVSIVKAENDLTQRAPGSPDVAPKTYTMPVKTLTTMMQENGDKYIDVLKIDIEGSEYLVLQDLFDRTGCPPVGQLTVEWHNFGLDWRYGSSPDLNAIHNLLNHCGFKTFYNRDHWRADPEVKQGVRTLPAMRITLASYCKDCLEAS